MIKSTVMTEGKIHFGLQGQKPAFILKASQPLPTLDIFIEEYVENN